MSTDSILVSWKPPTQPNGVVEQYTVYVRELTDSGTEASVRNQRVPPMSPMTYEATNLDSKKRYEFWVTASTNIGEGQPSKNVVISPNARGMYFFNFYKITFKTKDFMYFFPIIEQINMFLRLNFLFGTPFWILQLSN